MGPSVPDEVDEELEFHVEMRVREYLTQGLDADEARREALRRFGDIEQVKAVCRRVGLDREEGKVMREVFDEIRADLRHTLRQLRRSPAFALAAVGTLAVAIGANTAVFGAVDNVLLKPLPYEQPDELATIWTRYLPESGFDIPQFPISPAELLDFRTASRTTEAVGYYQYTARTVMGADGTPARHRAALVDGEFFPVLGMEAALGRLIGPDDDQPGTARMVLSHGLWQSDFGSDPGIVGRSLILDGQPVEVLGVTPPEFAFPDPGVRLWVSMGLDPTNLPGRASHFLVGVARLREGQTLAQVEEEARAIHAGWSERYEHNVGHFPIFISVDEFVVGADVRRALWLLFGAVALVLVIACANVASLLLTRAEARRGELAVRAALGAGRARLARQALTESLILATLGAAVGVGLAAVGSRVLLALHPEALPRSGEIAIGAGPLLFTAILAVGVSIVFGLVVALRTGSGSSDLSARGLRGAGGRSRTGVRQALVAGQVTLGVVVAVGATLLARSTVELARVDPGVDTEGILAVGLALPASDYPDADEVTAFWRAVVERVQALPGVRAASLGSALAFQGSSTSRQDFVIEGRPDPVSGETARNAERITIHPGWMELMGIPLREGRHLGPEDHADAPPAAVVNESLARAYFPGASPLGERVGYDVGDDEISWLTIVGVVADVRTVGPRDQPLPQLYLTAAQSPVVFPGSAPRSLTLALATELPAEAVVPGLRTAIAELDARLPLANVRMLDDVRRRALAQPRFITLLMAGFGVVALFLAALGVYGVVAYSVARRTREIGVRIAIGAPAAGVAALMVREGTLPALVGVVLGSLVALGSVRLLDQLLFGVAPTDPVTFLLVPALLTSIALMASWIPARRALRVAPTEALRAD